MFMLNESLALLVLQLLQFSVEGWEGKVLNVWIISNPNSTHLMALSRVARNSSNCF